MTNISHSHFSRALFSNVIWVGIFFLLRCPLFRPGGRWAAVHCGCGRGRLESACGRRGRLAALLQPGVGGVELAQLGAVGLCPLLILVLNLEQRKKKNVFLDSLSW